MRNYAILLSVLSVLLLSGCSASIHPILDSTVSDHEELTKEIKELNERIEDMNGTLSSLTDAALKLKAKMENSEVCRK